MICYGYVVKLLGKDNFYYLMINTIAIKLFKTLHPKKHYISLTEKIKQHGIFLIGIPDSKDLKPVPSTMSI
jgi:hypothetical protein